jgi:mannose-6-phosphate isomerase-like protein (cupin superfamily)
MNEELVHDPILKTRYRFSRKGDTERVEMWTDPGGGPKVPHFHPHFDENFEVLEGEVTYTVDGEKATTGAGERAVAPAGVRHTFENTGGVVAHHVCQAKTDGLIDLLTETAACSRAGAFTPRGIPKPGWILELADYLDRYSEVFVLTNPPPALQRMVVPRVARLARRRGKRAEWARVG